MPQSPQLLAQELAEHKRQIVADYRRHRSPQRFFADHTALLSHTVTALWRQMQPAGELALLALGGFGRGGTGFQVAFEGADALGGKGQVASFAAFAGYGYPTAL